MEQVRPLPTALPELYPGLNIITARIHELVQTDRLTYEISDGMDGAGKNTLTSTIHTYINNAIPGIHSLKFSFPAYETPIGHLITKLLHNMEFRASLPLLDRMILYSLNRLEVLPQLHHTILTTSNEGAVFCLFDRLFPSNLVTVAAAATELIAENQLHEYYFDNSSIEQFINPEVSRLHPLLEPNLALSTCWNLERFLFQALGISQPHVVMLLNANIEKALTQISISRQSQDLNEQKPIQFVTKAYYRWFCANSSNCVNFDTKDAAGNWKSQETVISELLPQLSLPQNTTKIASQFPLLLDHLSGQTINPSILVPIALEMGASGSLLDLLLDLS